MCFRAQVTLHPETMQYRTREELVCTGTKDRFLGLFFFHASNFVEDKPKSLIHPVGAKNLPGKEEKYKSIKQTPEGCRMPAKINQCPVSG